MWPELVVPIFSDNVAALWLTASDDFLRQRIYATSRFEEASDVQKEMIEKFVGRTLVYNQQMIEVVRRRDLPSMSVEDCPSEKLSERCLTLLEMR